MYLHVEENRLETGTTSCIKRIFVRLGYDNKEDDDDEQRFFTPENFFPSKINSHHLVDDFKSYKIQC